MELQVACSCLCCACDQNPVTVFQSLTFASSPAVASTDPSGEKESALMS